MPPRRVGLRRVGGELVAVAMGPGPQLLYDAEALLGPGARVDTSRDGGGRAAASRGPPARRHRCLPHRRRGDRRERDTRTATAAGRDRHGRDRHGRWRHGRRRGRRRLGPGVEQVRSRQAEVPARAQPGRSRCRLQQGALGGVLALVPRDHEGAEDDSERGRQQAGPDEEGDPPPQGSAARRRRRLGRRRLGGPRLGRRRLGRRRLLVCLPGDPPAGSFRWLGDRWAGAVWTHGSFRSEPLVSASPHHHGTSDAAFEGSERTPRAISRKGPIWRRRQARRLRRAACTNTK